MTREELELIENTLKEAMTPKSRPGLFTSEFWAMIVLVCLGISKNIVGMDDSTFISLSGILVAYIGSRTGVKMMGKDK